MMGWKCSGPWVQVKGVGFGRYFFKYRSRKILQSFFERWTLWVSACLVKDAEKAFDHVHPGGMGWRVVEVHPRMAQPPRFGSFILVDVQVVQHDVKFAQGIGLHHGRP